MFAAELSERSGWLQIFLLVFGVNSNGSVVIVTSDGSYGVDWPLDSLKSLGSLVVSWTSFKTGIFIINGNVVSINGTIPENKQVCFCGRIHISPEIVIIMVIFLVR
jgi:hypothetical protein